MMPIRQAGILFMLLALYGSSFFFMDKQYQERNLQLHSALPAGFYRATAGYLRQVTSEILFVKTSAFLGGVKPGTPADTYTGPLTNNFQVMTTLYPQFVDPYFFCQSFLAPISASDAEAANSILRTGIEYLPENDVLRLFLGFNYYRYLDDPLQAAAVFEEASARPNAPPAFGRLAAVFSAQGGDIQAGLVMLRAMFTVEQNEALREKYEQEISIFEKALVVEEAIQAYLKDNSEAPETLQELVPRYIDEIPKLSGEFLLRYDPPSLSLVRPSSLVGSKE